MLDSAFDFDKRFPGDVHVLQLQHSDKFSLTITFFQPDPAYISTNINANLFDFLFCHIKNFSLIKIEPKLVLFIYFKEEKCYNGTSISPELIWISGILRKGGKLYEEIKDLMYPADSGTHANIRHHAPGQR